MFISAKKRTNYRIFNLIILAVFLWLNWSQNTHIRPNSSQVQIWQSLFSTESGAFSIFFFGPVIATIFLIFELDNRHSYLAYYRTSRQAILHHFEKQLLFDAGLFSTTYVLFGTLLNQLFLEKWLFEWFFSLLLIITIVNTTLFLSFLGEISRILMIFCPDYLALVILICLNALLSIAARFFHFWIPLLEINLFSNFFADHLTILIVIRSFSRLLLCFIISFLIARKCLHREDIL